MLDMNKHNMKKTCQHSQKKQLDSVSNKMQIAELVNTYFDEISTKLVKEIIVNIIQPLTHIINLLLVLSLTNLR